MKGLLREFARQRDLTPAQVKTLSRMVLEIPKVGATYNDSERVIKVGDTVIYIGNSLSKYEHTTGHKATVKRVLSEKVSIQFEGTCAKCPHTVSIKNVQFDAPSVDKPEGEGEGGAASAEDKSSPKDEDAVEDAADPATPKGKTDPIPLETPSKGKPEAVDERLAEEAAAENELKERAKVRKNMPDVGTLPPGVVDACITQIRFIQTMGSTYIIPSECIRKAIGGVLEEWRNYHLQFTNVDEKAKSAKADAQTGKICVGTWNVLGNITSDKTSSAKYIVKKGENMKTIFLCQNYLPHVIFFQEVTKVTKAQPHGDIETVLLHSINESTKRHGVTYKYKHAIDMRGKPLQYGMAYIDECYSVKQEVCMPEGEDQYYSEAYWTVTNKKTEKAILFGTTHVSPGKSGGKDRRKERYNLYEAHAEANGNPIILTGDLNYYSALEDVPSLSEEFLDIIFSNGENTAVNPPGDKDKPRRYDCIALDKVAQAQFPNRVGYVSELPSTELIRQFKHFYKELGEQTTTEFTVKSDYTYYQWCSDHKLCLVHLT